MEPAEIERLYQAMKHAGFAVLTLEQAEQKLHLRLNREAFVPATSTPATSAGVGGEPEEPALPRSVTIFSERVGVFGAGKNPIQPGDQIKKGGILGVVKGISIQDQIVCSCDGVITQVCVRSGEIVEFGKPLFILEPNRE